MTRSRSTRPGLRARRGFSFIELLVVLIFIGLIVRIAVPRYKPEAHGPAAGMNLARAFMQTSEGRARVDLHRANLEQLTRSGVLRERVHALPLCTICRPEDFFSYRRDKKLHGRAGRLLSVIGFRNADFGFRIDGA